MPASLVFQTAEVRLHNGASHKNEIPDQSVQDSHTSWKASNFGTNPGKPGKSKKNDDDPAVSLWQIPHVGCGCPAGTATNATTCRFVQKRLSAQGSNNAQPYHSDTANILFFFPRPDCTMVCPTATNPPPPPPCTIPNTTQCFACSGPREFILCLVLQGQVYLYYGLSNYYQNHRRYVKSRDDKQLGGADITREGQLSGDCEPFRANGTGTPYAPCGAIANSLFNGERCLKGYAHGETRIFRPSATKSGRPYGVMYVSSSACRTPPPHPLLG